MSRLEEKNQHNINNKTNYVLLTKWDSDIVRPIKPKTQHSDPVKLLYQNNSQGNSNNISSLTKESNRKNDNN
jgi:hypothetical protein